MISGGLIQSTEVNTMPFMASSLPPDQAFGGMYAILIC